MMVIAIGPPKMLRASGIMPRMAASAVSTTGRARRTVAGGALGFWQVVEEVWPQTRGQRCWVHKTANVLNKLPNSQQPKAKRALQEIWMTETKKDALAAFDAFVETWGVKYDKAVEIKDRDALLAFYDFPAEHWKHLRTTNVIESSFATVRHRTVCSKGCLSNKIALAMIFKLAEAAEKTWRRLNGHKKRVPPMRESK
jgi:putative transposase